MAPSAPARTACAADVAGQRADAASSRRAAQLKGDVKAQWSESSRRNGGAQCPETGGSRAQRAVDLAAEVRVVSKAAPEGDPANLGSVRDQSMRRGFQT